MAEEKQKDISVQTERCCSSWGKGGWWGGFIPLPLCPSLSWKWSPCLWYQPGVSHKRIMESFELEGSLKSHLVQVSCNEWVCYSCTRLLRAWSSLTLNVSKDGASTNSLDNLERVLNPSIKGCRMLMAPQHIFHLQGVVSQGYLER